MVQEHIASQVVMSSIDPEVEIRNQSIITSQNGLGGRDGGFSILGEDETAYEKLTSSRTETSSNNSSSAAADAFTRSRTTPSNNRASSKMTLTCLLKSIYDHMEQIRYRIQRDTFLQCACNEWLLVGTLVDKILFFIYCSIVIFCTLTIFKNY